MNVSDKLTLITLSSKYGISDISSVLANLHKLNGCDLNKLSEIMDRLPNDAVDVCVHNPLFAKVLETFIATTDQPRPTALAFLKLGIPLRRLVLPKRARQQINLRLSFRGGRIFVNDEEVDLSRATYSQQQALNALLR